MVMFAVHYFVSVFASTGLHKTAGILPRLFRYVVAVGAEVVAETLYKGHKASTDAGERRLRGVIRFSPLNIFSSISGSKTVCYNMCERFARHSLRVFYMSNFNKLLVFVALVCSVLLFWGGPGAYSSRSFQQAWNLGHLLLFAILTYLTLKWSETISHWPFFKQVTVLLTAVFLISLPIEFTQMGLDGRSPDVFDILRNMVGCLFAVVFFSPSRKKTGPTSLRFFQIGVVTALMLFAVPLAFAIADEIITLKQFPVLSDFETPLERMRWTGGAGHSVVSERARSGNHSLKIHLHTSQYSGVALDYFPQDWRNYRALAFSVFNPSDIPLKLVCRIHDESHYPNGGDHEDRFNRTLVVCGGWNDIEISLADVMNAPQGRKMDMRRVQNIGIFSVRLPQERVIYLDYLRLMK
jgi:glycopeptide antibiotics resistance protein